MYRSLPNQPVHPANKKRASSQASHDVTMHVSLCSSRTPEKPHRGNANNRCAVPPEPTCRRYVHNATASLGRAAAPSRTGPCLSLPPQAPPGSAWGNLDSRVVSFLTCCYPLMAPVLWWARPQILTSTSREDVDVVQGLRRRRSKPFGRRKGPRAWPSRRPVTGKQSPYCR